MPESYCGDETDLIKYSGNSDSVPDFQTTISQIGSSANMVPPMTPKSDIHVYVFIYCIWAAIPHRVRGTNSLMPEVLQASFLCSFGEAFVQFCQSIEDNRQRH